MSLPYFPMFPADFEADTSHLTLEEDGAYNRLLRLCWLTPGCSVPDSPEWITRRMRIDGATYERVVSPLLDEFFRRSGGRVFSPRLRAVFEETNEKHKRRVMAGKKGGRPRKALETNIPDQSNAKAMPKQPEPEPYSKKESANALSVRTCRFQDFWDAYPHRDGVKKNRKGAEGRYRVAVKAGVSEDDLVDAASRYRNDPQVARGYARDPTTWLNQRGWEDEPAANVHPFPNTGGQNVSPRQSREDAEANALRDKLAFAGRNRGSSKPSLL